MPYKLDDKTRIMNGEFVSKLIGRFPHDSVLRDTSCMFQLSALSSNTGSNWRYFHNSGFKMVCVSKSIRELRGQFPCLYQSSHSVLSLFVFSFKRT